MRVSSAQFLKQYGMLSDKALTEPVTITRNGRDRLVLMSAETFEHLHHASLRARRIEELTQAEVAAITLAEVPAAYAHLDSLLED